MKTWSSWTCCFPGCSAKVVVPNPLLLGWTAATCAYGHACWVVRAVGKTVVMRRHDGPEVREGAAARKSAQH